MNTNSRTLSRAGYAVVAVAGLISLGASEIRVDRGPHGDLSYRLKRKTILNDKVKKELSSGLTTQLVLITKLEDTNHRAVAEQIHKFSIRYDLWEEKYWMETAGETDKRAFASRAELEAWIEGPGPFSWIPLPALNPGMGYQIECLETLNPVSQERLAELQKWVTEQRVMSRAGSPQGGQGDLSIANETPFSALFYGLWKRAAAGELAGDVQRQAESGVFRADQMGAE